MSDWIRNGEVTPRTEARINHQGPADSAIPGPSWPRPADKEGNRSTHHGVLDLMAGRQGDVSERDHAECHLGVIFYGPRVQENMGSLRAVQFCKYVVSDWTGA